MTTGPVAVGLTRRSRGWSLIAHSALTGTNDLLFPLEDLEKLREASERLVAHLHQATDSRAVLMRGIAVRGGHRAWRPCSSAEHAVRGSDSTRSRFVDDATGEARRNQADKASRIGHS